MAGDQRYVQSLWAYLRASAELPRSRIHECFLGIPGDPSPFLGPGKWVIFTYLSGSMYGGIT